MLRSQLSLIVRGIVVVALAFSCGIALAESDAESANSVTPGCHSLIDGNNDTDRSIQGFCLGIVATLEIWGGVGKFICAPKGVTRLQMIRVVVQYIDNRPARMHERFDLLALEAMKAAWPCKP